MRAGTGGLAILLLVMALAGCGGEGERRSRGDQGALSSLGGIGGGNKAGKAAEPDPASEGGLRAGPAAPDWQAPAASQAAPSATIPSGVNATGQPVRGSPQRAAIMDALRPAIERELGGPVEFVVQRAAVQNGWALVIAQPQRPGGGAITPPRGFDMEFRDGLTVNGILRFTGRGWSLVDHAIGPTDVWYCGVDGPPSSLTGC